jgi:dihydropyrimidinase
MWLKGLMTVLQEKDMALIIKNGTLVTAEVTIQADILIEGEKIILIEKNIAAPADAQVVDAAGKLVLPGGVDVHTHFDLPMFGTVSSDDHYTGHKAAAYGGTTTVIDFIPQDTKPLLNNVEKWHEKVDHKAAIDYSFHMNITQLDEQVEKEIPSLVNEGVTSLKVFTAYNERLRLADDKIFRVMRIAKNNGMLVMLHAENGDVIELLIKEALAAGHKTPEWHALTRPAWGAVEATLRGAALAAMAEAPLYIVHMNVAGEVDQLAYVRNKGLPVMGETCPQYLFFSIEHLRRPDGSKWVCSPPMRSTVDNERLWEGLVDGTIQVLATDHCPFFYNGSKPILYEDKLVAIPGKELGQGDFTKIPNGLPAVGDRLPVFWTKAVGSGRITPNRFVELTSTNPAKIFGMYPQKGTIAPGSDADIVIWDPGKKVQYGVAVAQHRTDYNLFEGWDLTGLPEKIYLRGSLIVDSGHWYGVPGKGRFIKRKPSAHVL